MNSNRFTVGDDVFLGREHWDVSVRVEFRAYLRFSRQLDRQLRRLVVRWAHTAAPSARGVATRAGQTEVSVPPTV